MDDSGLLGCDAKSLGKWFFIVLKERVAYTFKGSRSVEGEGNMVSHRRRSDP